ncbi:MAG: DUF3299 domain-containing protein [Gammaproteobacteria bacterium]|nr:DUF3299 domain-containing protein [Gammaproteobacteria bacterium]MDH5736256.1 DUF3299 domain-containing protein [Gammaproteobacteria bacterium]
MMKLHHLSGLLICLLLSTFVHASDYKTLQWTDLIPKSVLDILLNPPEVIQKIQDGTPEDELDSELLVDLGSQSDSPYFKALTSTEIIPEYNNKKVRIPGFIVPLEFDDDQVITAFFLVPYFGACIHQPAPPPNQMIYVTSKKGLKLEVLYDPFWIEGTLYTGIKDTDIGVSAYTMTAARIEPYKE